jgi:hypothetical protein
MMAFERYSHFAKFNPARDILPSFVMNTCHLFVIFSVWPDKKEGYQLETVLRIVACSSATFTTLYGYSSRFIHLCRPESHEFT